MQEVWVLPEGVQTTWHFGIPRHKEIGRFPNVAGLQSNCQIDAGVAVR